MNRDPAAFVGQLMASRQTVLPKRLMAPGPDEAQISSLFLAASSAPDHGQINPWRFVLIPGHKREALAHLFARALLERDASATAEQLDQAREKAFRGPFLMLLTVDEGNSSHEIDVYERLLSAGCAVQNIMLLATAMGYGTGLTSGKALKSACLRAGFGLGDTHRAVCFLTIGTISSARPLRQRPDVRQFVTVWGDSA